MTRTVSLSSRATIRAHVLFRDLHGELVVLEPRRGVYFGLDAIGTRIWHLLQEPRPLTDVVVALVTEYEVDEAEAAADVLDLVRQLQEQGLVDVGD